MTGFVSLVGAGPGDPELLTLRALNRLRDADLVLYDALVDDELLGLAPRAKRFYVGKRAGKHSIDQAGIHRLMIRAAQRGERVVRLKCGDPFVLGRGGEEALALEAAGIAYEIVPGVSSALAAPALAGIPVTHRGLAAGFAVISGHAASAFGPAVDSLAPGSLTVVVLMGLRTRAELVARLVARGWSVETPAAIVLGASHDGTARWLGTLATLAEAPVDTELAGVIVIGEVVTLATQIVSEHARTEFANEHAQAARRSEGNRSGAEAAEGRGRSMSARSERGGSEHLPIDRSDLGSSQHALRSGS